MRIEILDQGVVASRPGQMYAWPGITKTVDIECPLLDDRAILNSLRFLFVIDLYLKQRIQYGSLESVA